MKQVAISDNSRRKALVCVGSNVTSHWGSPRQTVAHSAKLISDRIHQDLQQSRYFRTPAYPEGSGDDFVNAAFSFETDWDAETVMSMLHEIEAEADRVRKTRWAARTLDLDLIALGGEVAPDAATWTSWMELDLKTQMERAPEQLILPHPRVQDRAFALVPLCDLAPDWVHPVLKQTIEQLKSALPEADLSSVIALN